MTDGLALGEAVSLLLPDAVTVALPLSLGVSVDEAEVEADGVEVGGVCDGDGDELDDEELLAVELAVGELEPVADMLLLENADCTSSSTSSSSRIPLPRQETARAESIFAT